MVGFRKIALLQAHSRLSLTHDYYISDLTELCGLAACVRDHVDEVSIPVTPNDRNPLASFERFMRGRKPDLVGISCFTCSASSALQYAEIAQRHDAFVVMGGYHPSALPDEILRSPFVDVVVRGEGEETFAELVKGSSPGEIAGLSFRDGSGTVHNPDRPLIADLDSLPLPLREIRPPRFGLAGLDYHSDTIYASRGCRANCSFCANHLVGKTWRKRSNESVLAELLTIPPPRKGPWKYVKFWDPNFMTDSDRVGELCDLILEHGLERNFRFIVETRVEDVIRAREILGKMRKAGFTRIGCGVESPNRETHKLLRKGINLAHVQQAVDLITKSDILVSKALIVGHPNEDADDILAYPEYSLAHGVELQNTVFMVMTPYPGTEIATYYREHDLLKSYDWNLYTNIGAVVAPSGLSTLELQTLLCAVTAKYGMSRRFLLGHRFPEVVVRLFEAMLIHALIARVNREYSRTDIETSLWEALVSIEGSRERGCEQTGRRRFLDRVSLYFHLADREPVVVSMVRLGDREVLSIRVAEERYRTDRRRPAIHLSVAQIVALAGSFNIRRITSDALTLSWNPRAFKLSWLPTFGREVGVLIVALAAMTIFHLKTSISRRWKKTPA